MTAKASLYRERKERFERDVAQHLKVSRRVSNLRALCFLVAAVAVVVALITEPLAGWVALAFGVLFLVLVIWHSRVHARLEVAGRWALVNERSLARVTGEWRQLPDTGASLKPEEHVFAEDLDLFGHGSLYQRISVAHTRYGQQALRHYLCDAVDHAGAVARQGAVRALEPELETRQHFESLAMAAVESFSEQSRGTSQQTRVPPDPEPFFQWAQGRWDPRMGTLLRVASWVLPVWTLSGIVGSFVLGWPVAVWIVPLLFQLACISASREASGAAFQALTATEGTLRRYAPMLALVESLQSRSELLGTLQKELGGDADKPSVAMDRLWRVSGWFSIRENAMVHPFINTLFLWDLHCTVRLEAWRRRYGAQARGWFDVLGAFEALSSLAGFAHDDPSAVWPELVENAQSFDATQLAHPLIDPPKRVGNDVSLLEAGRALLVTGSNMSGKSTLLRAMGIAAVMARAGTQVCAQGLSLSLMPICTSIRVSDSLEAGVSHFYAEVRRLRDVLASAQDGPVLFLLDEILHGTNSTERQVGARWVLSELLRLGSIGVISTHDMELCQVGPELVERVTLVHLRENVKEGRMTFDYRVRPGPVTAGNALRLMREVGLPVPG